MFKNPLVIGYKGEIGSFILNGLLRTMPKALNILCYDVNEVREEQVERIERADVIFLCLPMEETFKWFDLNRGLLRKKTIIEQCSLKEEICLKIKELQKEFGFTLLSMHILFRPSATPNKEDKQVLLIKHLYWNALRKDIEEITNSAIYWCENCKVHDKIMAKQQALVHRVLLSLDKCLYITHETYVTKKVKELVERIKNGDATLYSLIQQNKYLPVVLKDFNRNLKNFNIKKQFKRD